MVKQCVKWKLFKCKNLLGKDIEIETPEIIDIRYRGTLLSNILAMPKKSPISFEGALLLLREKQRVAFDLGNFGDKPEQYGWYDLHFVAWISSLGFHIEITGDEFEATVTSLSLN